MVTIGLINFGFIVLIVVFCCVKMPPKRKCLSLEERVQALKLFESGKSTRVIADQMGVGRTQIQNAVKRKRDIMDEYEANENVDMKRHRRATEYDEINQLTHKWFLDATARKINVSGPLLQQRALKFASDLKLDNFKASNGWLQSFLKRHNIVFKTMSGERGGVNVDTVTDWKEKLPTICEGYEPCNIFNMDETGLFYRDSTKSTYFTKGETCTGGKRSKERITVGLCASMTGEKVPPLVIGKSENPRCFSKIKKDQLPVRYYANKKAWMTGALMVDWLKWLDRKMAGQGRKILLFVDNAPSHPHCTLNNVKLQFLPANTTSVCQPMDQGIIQTLKLKYRKRQLQHVIAEMDSQPTKTGIDLLRAVDVLQAIYWIGSAWKEVLPSTVEKCFARCGFSANEPSVSDPISAPVDDSEEDDYPLAVHKMSKELFDCEFRDLLDIDKDFATSDTNMEDWDRNAADILADYDDVTSEESCAPVEPVAEATPAVTFATAAQCVRQLKEFALQKGKCSFLDHAMEMQDMLTQMRMDSSVRQSTISDFFK